MVADTVVIGLGAAGAFAARELARRGTSVIGLERRSLLHDDGAYAGESRLFRAAYHEGTEYLPMLLDSRREWLETEKQGRRRLFVDCGVLTIGNPEAPQLRNVLQSLRDVDLPHTVLEPTQLRDTYPQHADVRDEIGVLDQYGGVLRAEAAVAQVQEQAIAAGADLRPSHEVIAIEESAQHVDVVTSQGTIRAARALVSAGVWTGRLLPELARDLTIRPIALTWFAPPNPDAYRPEVFPGFIRDRADTHVFGVPTLDGNLFKAGFAAQWGDISSPDDLSRRLRPEQLETVGRAVHEFLPDMPVGVSRQSVHMDAFTTDKRPVLGQLTTRVTVATGFSGHGFKLAPALGITAARIALDEDEPYDVAAFRPRARA